MLPAIRNSLRFTRNSSARLANGHAQRIILPRPDGAGSFLYLAGIHAPGILGAAHYIADNIAELHRELKTRRFSVLISCQFDPADRRKILSTGRLTPLYRHDGP